jgi:hypothetical protein
MLLFSAMRLSNKHFKCRTYFVCLASLILMLLNVPELSLARDWYVRPDDGSYGKKDGSSYDNAWRGLLNVVWGGHGLKSGDTLWICGVHIYELRSRKNIVRAANITPISGESESNRVIIRGDYPGDEGIIWGAARASYSEWATEGSGLYSIPIIGNQYPDWFFQIIDGRDNKGYFVLSKSANIEEATVTHGTHYSNTYTKVSRLYIRTTDGMYPGRRVLVNRWGYRFNLGDHRYITFLNLTFYNIYKFVSEDASIKPSHIRWQNCKMHYGEHSIVTVWDLMDNIEVINCEISHASNGIYNISQTNNAPRHYVYRNNYIHDIGTLQVNRNKDAHAIGIQGGEGGVIESNQIDNCGSGLMLYAFTNQILKNTIVRQNVIRDLHTLGNASGIGIGTMCNNDSLSDKSGNVIIHNVVINSPVAYLLQFEINQIFYNNVSVNCKIGLNSARSYLAGNQIIGPFITGRKNIFCGTKRYHVDFNTNSKSYVLDLDNNIYYPDGNEMFKFNNRKYGFSAWREMGYDSMSKISGSICDNIFNMFSK